MNYVLLWHELCFFMDELCFEPARFGSNIMSGIMFYLCFIMFYIMFYYVLLWLNQ